MSKREKFFFYACTTSLALNVVGCKKPAKSSQKSLDNFLGDGFTQNVCAPFSGNAKLDKSTSGRIGAASQVAPEFASIASECVKSIPVGLQQLYFDQYHGKIATTPKATACNPQGITKFTACFVDAPTGPVITLAANKANIQMETVRQFGYFIAKKLFVQLHPLKKEIGQNLLRDALASGNPAVRKNLQGRLPGIIGDKKAEEIIASIDSLANQSAKMPPTNGKPGQLELNLTLVDRFYEDSVAEAFDSYYGSPTSRSKMKQSFPRVFGTFETKIAGALNECNLEASCISKLAKFKSAAGGSSGTGKFSLDGMTGYFYQNGQLYYYPSTNNVVPSSQYLYQNTNTQIASSLSPGVAARSNMGVTSYYLPVQQGQGSGTVNNQVYNYNYTQNGKPYGQYVWNGQQYSFYQNDAQGQPQPTQRSAQYITSQQGNALYNSGYSGWSYTTPYQENLVGPRQPASTASTTYSDQGTALSFNRGDGSKWVSDGGTGYYRYVYPGSDGQQSKDYENYAYYDGKNWSYTMKGWDDEKYKSTGLTKYGNSRPSTPASTTTGQTNSDAVNGDIGGTTIPSSTTSTFNDPEAGSSTSGIAPISGQETVTGSSGGSNTSDSSNGKFYTPGEVNKAKQQSDTEPGGQGSWDSDTSEGGQGSWDSDTSEGGQGSWGPESGSSGP